MSDKINATNKDVIYIDVDDEITGVIDKVRGSHSKIVALVLPKRATVLQSVVNMKLLKRSADESKKNVVLITSESGLLPLAGGVGMHVAKTLQSKPEVPDAPARTDGRAEVVNEDDDITDGTEDGRPLDANRPVGELAGAAAMEDTIELDNEEPESLSSASLSDGKENKKGKDKKLKVPNFNKFRLILIVSGIALVALIVFGYFAMAVMPKATVSIKTDSQSLTSSTVVTLKVGDAVTFDAKDNIVPAKSQQTQKVLTQEAPATGEENNGEKASGTVTIKNCTDDPVTIPAGTAVTSAGMTFMVDTSLSLGSGNFSGGGACKTTGDHIGNTSVTAQHAGTKYNIAAGVFSVPGLSSKITGSSSDAMTGGTDDIIKIVTQSDIDSATQKLGNQSTDGIKDQLKTDLVNKGYMPILETFNAGTPQTKTSVNAKEKADSVTVTQTITYTMLGAKQDDLKKIVAADVNTKIDSKKQSILDYGLDAAVFGLQGQPDDGATLTMQTEVVAGPDLKVADIKKQIAGKKANDAREIVKQNPGVTEVEVQYSPFWVSSIPKKESKITVTIEKPKAASSSSSNADEN